MQSSVTVNSEAARQQLDSIAATVDGPRREALMQVLGKGLEGDLKGHFLKKNQKGNKRGWKSREFWRDIAKATHFAKATQSSATVAISDPRINPHLYGATLKPRKAKFLAIPMREEAYGTSPRGNKFPDLYFLPRKKKPGGFLARRNPDGSNRLYYFLTRSVKVPKDPHTLPSQSELDRAAVSRAERHIERISQ